MGYFLLVEIVDTFVLCEAELEFGLILLSSRGFVNMFLFMPFRSSNSPSDVYSKPKDVCTTDCFLDTVKMFFDS